LVADVAKIACSPMVNGNCAFASSHRIICGKKRQKHSLKIFGLMHERWTIISGSAFSPFLYVVFVAIIYIMTIQLRINNIYNNNYASVIRHNISHFSEWQKDNYLDIL